MHMDVNKSRRNYLSIRVDHPVCLRLLFCHSHNFSILQKQIQMGLHQIGRIDHQTIFDQCFHPLHPLAFLFDRIRSLINQ